MPYLVVIEKGESSYGAYVPDLAGVAVVGRTLTEVKRLAREAIRLHVDGLRADGLAVPPANARGAMIDGRGRPTRHKRAKLAKRVVAGKKR